MRQAARAIEGQLREDQQELEMRERKRKVEDAKKIRGIVHEKDKSKASRRVQDEMGRLTHTGRSGVHSPPQDVHKSLQGSVLERVWKCYY